MRTIIELQDYVNKLSDEEKEKFDNIYSLDKDVGKLKVGKDMKAWVKKTFGNVEGVENQEIVRIDNKTTFESALFNKLRAMRPVDASEKQSTAKVIAESEGGPFCNPEKKTPEDVFGRVKGKHSTTASNVAKYDSYHGLVVFEKHDPLDFTSEDIKDHLKTAESWIKKGYEQDSDRKFPFIMWNCLWKSGASILHGHMQVLLAKHKHYGEVEKLRHFAEAYEKENGTDYLEDLYEVHESVGLGLKHKDNNIFVHLTPVKEKEVLIISPTLNNVYEDLYKVLDTYREMGVESFNVGVYMEPLDAEWKMPIVIRVVDRGSLSSKTVDIGGMELFAGTTIIASDPYKVFEKLKEQYG